MEAVSPALRQTVLEVHGPLGQAWLDDLPALLAEYARRWHLDVGPPFAGLSYNYVATAVDSAGTAVALKLGVPCREMAAEIAALQHFDGEGAVRLLKADADAGVLLLERLRPGSSLADLADEDAAIPAAAQVLRRLWRPLPPEDLLSTATAPSDPAVSRSFARFPTVADWSKGFSRLRARFDGGTGPLPGAWVRAAEALFAELLTSSGASAAPALLHGDLHHGNILAAERDPWLAIDPKGLIGEREYDAAVFLRSVARRGGGAGPSALILSRRLRHLADALGFDGARLRDWAVAQAILSAWWHIEDHQEGWEREIEWAEVLATAKV